MVHWSPFVQSFRKRYPWVQLAGHQGKFQPHELFVVLSRGISQKSNMWHFQFSIWLRSSLRGVHFVINLPESDQWFQSWSNWKILKTTENKRNTFLFLAVSHYQYPRLPSDPTRSQHIWKYWLKLHQHYFNGLTWSTLTFWSNKENPGLIIYPILIFGGCMYVDVIANLVFTLIVAKSVANTNCREPWSKWSQFKVNRMPTVCKSRVSL